MIALAHTTTLAYAALFGLVAAESAGAPVPGETALITAAVLAHNGHLGLALVIGLAAAAAIAGDNAGYLIGRTGGRRLLERPGALEHHRHEMLRRGEPFFRRHGPKAVFLARWVIGMRVAGAWLAGINRMRWRSFLLWNALGGIGWATSVGLLAYALGPAAGGILKTTGIGGIAVAVVAACGYALWRHRRSRRVGRRRPAQRRRLRAEGFEPPRS